MNKKIDICPNDLAIVKQILQKHLTGPGNVWVFGSRAKCTARKFSDLDLVIDLNHQPLPLKQLTCLLDDFEESDLPYKVDLVDWNTIGKDFKLMIADEKILLIKFS